MDSRGWQVGGIYLCPRPLKSALMNQDQLKQLVGEAALAYVQPNTIIGVGTGSTVNCFIRALPQLPFKVTQAVSSSEASTVLLREQGVEVLDANQVDKLSVYIDGADEIDHSGCMIKGGGAALTREKITAAMSEKFVCIADESKLVGTLGAFPLPVEVIPMAAQAIMRRFALLGGQASLRLKDGQPLVTDNGGHIVDVRGLGITNPLQMEAEVNQWPGVVTVGIFAQQKASVCLLGTAAGVKTLNF